MSRLLLDILPFSNKEASEKVSPHPENWDEDVTKSFISKRPNSLQNLDFEIHWVSKDEQKGYGWGAIIVSSERTPIPSDDKRIPTYSKGEITKIAIPIIIKNFQLYPMDVFIYN